MPTPQQVCCAVGICCPPGSTAQIGALAGLLQEYAEGGDPEEHKHANSTGSGNEATLERIYYRMAKGLQRDLGMQLAVGYAIVAAAQGKLEEMTNGPMFEGGAASSASLG